MEVKRVYPQPVVVDMDTQITLSPEEVNRLTAWLGDAYIYNMNRGYADSIGKSIKEFSRVLNGSNSPLCRP